MSTPKAPTSEEVKSDLNQIGDYLFQVPDPLLPEEKPTTEQTYLKKLKEQLKTYRTGYLQRSRALYQTLATSDLQSTAGKQLIATLKIRLNTQLLDMDARDRIDGKPAKTFINYDAGFTAIAHEAQQAVSDRLLHSQAGDLLNKLDLGPRLRPAIYALQFIYQGTTVDLAGAFIVTEKDSPRVSDLLTDQSVGYAVLFTPARGIEFFNSLTDLDAHLRASLNQRSSRDEFMQMLPTRYHDIGAAGIWPLSLAPVDSKPLFEHTYDTLIKKRTQDVERALSFADNPQEDPKLLLAALDKAIAAALPDLTPRLELRAQTLFERHLRYSAPDWYRSASSAKQLELAQHLSNYQQARQHLLDLMEPVGTLMALARQQWLERLSDDLEIEDLEPEKLQISTDRRVPGYGVYVHKGNLLDLSLRGPHTGDELPGSEFLSYTTLTYDGEPLSPDHADLTPAWLVKQAISLQPRIDFNGLQKDMHAAGATKPALERMLDQRIVALAHTAVLQGHLLESDLLLIERLRSGSDPHLRAATLSLHGAQLQDLWILRQSDASGAIKRILLCTPQAPREQQFQAFGGERECQTHLLGWAKHSDSADSMAGYLISRAPMRFRPTLRKVLAALSFKPEALEHQKVTFDNCGDHLACLKAMAEHVLATRVDDYDFSTPLWYRSTTAANRRKLATLSEEAEGALLAFNQHALSGSQFPTFDDYVHQQAKASLNRLLKRAANDVDPDTVWAYSPMSIVPALTPKPLSYTQLYRDGYADGVGFLDAKFSRSARFKGPSGVDVSSLTAQNVARSVTGVWIGERYTNKVKSDLQSSTSEGYEFRRNTTLAITQRQMKSAALECQLQGHIASHDLLWLEQSISSMDESSGAIRTKFPIHRLMIDGEWVIDTWLFSHADNPVLLYTPDAPDGVRFREARLFNYLLQQQAGMIEYFTTRVGVSAQTRVRTFLENAKKQLPKNLNKTTPSPARYDATPATAAVSDLRAALYNMKLQRRIDNVSATTTSRAEMIAGLIWTSVEWLAAIATAPFPLLSLSTGLLLAFKDAMLAMHAYRQGDHGEAFRHFLGYLFNSAGAVLTDLRPALRSLKPVNRPLRQALASAADEQQNLVTLIDQVAPQPEWDNMRVVVFRGQLFHAGNNPDALGRYLLYRQQPNSPDLVSTGILVVPNADGVMVRSGMIGGAPKYDAVPDTPGPHKDYGVAEKYRQRVELVMNPQTREDIILRQQDYMGTSPQAIMIGRVDELASTRSAYLKQVEKLTNDTTRHFAELAPLPARAEVPAVAADLSPARLIASDAFKGKNLVIGAQPGSIASKQLLIDDMDVLATIGFKRLYVEYLAGDVFNLKLEKMNKGGTWKHIKTHLKAVDRALGHEKDAPYSYLALVQAARKQGLTIHALDASTSYQLEHAMVMADISPLTPRNNSIRNFYSHKTLSADIADATEERWIVLTEQSRMSTFDNTPGLADLHDAIALRVEDIDLSQARRVGLDSPGSIAGDPAAKGDYLVQTPTAYKAPQPVSKPAATVAVVDHFSDYDIAPSLRDNIAQMLHGPHAMDARFRSVASSEKPAHDAFIAMRTRLEKKARDTFTDYIPPEAPILPSLTSDTTFEAFLQQLSERRLNLLIGEAHGDVSSKALLKKYMKSLKQAGYDSLYMEHVLTDLHQADLNIFLQTQRMPDRLKAYLRRQDRGHMRGYEGNDTYTEVYQAAAKYNVRIKALDCTASYYPKGLSDEIISRNEMFSYFATQVIEADQLANGPHKWVALIGNAHTNYNLGVPGLADTLSAVSLHVRDTTTELARDIHRGAGEVVADRGLQSDFLMEVAVAGTKKPAATPSVSRSKLTQPGLFLIEHEGPSGARLVHKSKAGDIVVTPIQVNDKGLLFIDRWEKKDQGFKYLRTLVEMLEKDVKLTQVK
ncbi:membrane-targeted effector domain-containing toxin [Pseudomonas granadensis]|uniref:Membrane-targeted effector domain-containing toxin n=1 Tax=Pseudomonas granadensis TaxID=1421430 RepID=A0ABX7GLT2_9PSED|nr:membrane-targeted effector domain-containing toxin [Pseudomonas granadensis]QRK85334.1 membrane-targeted effector domain-containing toxin [Pseudomonas granadensis]